VLVAPRLAPRVTELAERPELVLALRDRPGLADGLCGTGPAVRAIDVEVTDQNWSD